MHIRVVSHRLVKASDPSLNKPRVDAVSNLDLDPNSIQGSVTCVYPKPAKGGDFNGVVAAFEAHFPTLLNYFYPLTGRIVFDPSSPMIPELHCHNQGAELIVADAGVPLCSLDWGSSEESLKRIQLPYAEEIPLSVQLISFTCGGFAVVWSGNNLMGDGNMGMNLVKMWSELVRSGGTSFTGQAPNHDRSLFRPRDPPSYRASIEGLFTSSSEGGMVNALTAEQSFIERLYYIEASDIARLRHMASTASRAQAVSAYLWKVFAAVVGSSKLLAESDKRCRMLWWVDGRRVLAPELRSKLGNYAGNVVAYAVREADVETILEKPLPELAMMVRETIASIDGEHIQGLVDWIEVHKPHKFIETPIVGLGSPTLGQTMWSSFPTDTDFGFGHASLALPVDSRGRLCAGVLCIGQRPGDSGSWILSAYIWPRLAAALEADKERIFKPLTPEYLGFTPATAKYDLLPDPRPRL